MSPIYLGGSIDFWTRRLIWVCLICLWQSRVLFFFISLPSRTRSGSGTGTSYSLWDMVSFNQSSNIDSTGSKGFTSEPFLAFEPFHLISLRCCASLAGLWLPLIHHTVEWAHVQTPDLIIEKESVEISSLCLASATKPLFEGNPTCQELWFNCQAS